MYAILDSHDRLVDTVIREGDAQAAAARVGGTPIDIGTADIAHLARIALADCPALGRVGQGTLGAGTHPAQPYLDAMLGMHEVGTVYRVDDIRFGYDTADDIVRHFLGNATGWRGEVAREVKGRLKGMLS